MNGEKGRLEDWGYYKSKSDNFLERMPKLVKEGKVLSNVSQLMKNRLEEGNNSDPPKGMTLYYTDRPFVTADTIAQHPDGIRAKIDLDSKILRGANPSSRLNERCALVLTEDEYSSLEGEEFKVDEIGIIWERLSKEQAKEHLIWKVLARDQNLLNDYVDYIVARREGSGIKDPERVMAVEIESAKRNLPGMMMWNIRSLLLGSNLSGWYSLDGAYHLEGILPEV